MAGLCIWLGPLEGMQTYPRVAIRVASERSLFLLFTWTEQILFESITNIWVELHIFPLGSASALQDVSPFVILISQKTLSISACQIIYHSKNITGKCLLLSLRVKLERHSVCTLVLGWTVFSCLETFLVLFLSRCFLIIYPTPFITLSPILGDSTPFPIFQISYLRLSCFLCLHFWLDVFFYLQHHCCLCSVVSVMQTATSRCFLFFYSHELQPFVVVVVWIHSR